MSADVEPHRGPNGFAPQPTAGDLEQAIHALHCISMVVAWIEHEGIDKGDDAELEVKHGLMMAHRLITEDFRRRF